MAHLNALKTLAEPVTAGYRLPVAWQPLSEYHVALHLAVHFLPEVQWLLGCAKVTVCVCVISRTSTKFCMRAMDLDGVREVVFCGLGEPTLRLNTVLHVADNLKRRGMRIRVNTDGLANRLYHRDITPLLENKIDALSVSLNAQDEATYNRYCRPRFSGSHGAVIDFLRRSAKHVPDVTATAIDGLEGVDISACREIAQGAGVKFRRRMLDEVG